LNEALNVDGSDWDPFGYYIRNSGNIAMEFTTDDSWQGVWTMEQGNIGFGVEYPNPPTGAQMRLTMVAEPQTRVIQAPLDGPERNGKATLQQDFVVVERQAAETVFTSLYEPVAVGQMPRILHAETIAEQGDGQARVIRVTTTAGEDWFLVGTEDFHEVRSPKRIGPFLTNAALALVRVRDQAVVEVMFAGGESLIFDDGTTRITIESDAAIYHAPDSSVSLSDTP
jgi:hypothetical protein